MNTKQDYIIRKQIEKKYHRLLASLQETKAQDTLQLSSAAGAVKYITRSGTVRLDIDYDVFTWLFYQSVWNDAVIETLYEYHRNHPEGPEIPKVVELIINQFFPKRQCLELAEMVRIMEPLFDDRNSPR